MPQRGCPSTGLWHVRQCHPAPAAARHQPGTAVRWPGRARTRHQGGVVTITSYNPRTGQANGTVEEMSPTRSEAAVERASGASSAVAAASPRQRRGWLHAVGAALVANTAELVELAEVETALGYTRLTSEISRAAGQLRFYGDVAAEGSYLAATIDRPTSTTPGLARVNQPLGPVAVFGASNFPFAFGVLGNDFGSASRPAVQWLPSLTQRIRC